MAIDAAKSASYAPMVGMIWIVALISLVWGLPLATVVLWALGCMVSPSLRQLTEVHLWAGESGVSP